jgi:hypothetical protein
MTDSSAAVKIGVAAVARAAGRCIIIPEIGE